MAEILETYPHLGGIRVELKDGNLVIRNDPTPPPTQSVLLLGTATDGPVMQPTAVDAETAQLVFGSVVDKAGRPNGATLMLAFEEAWQEGCRDVRLMRISGKPATAELQAQSRTQVNYHLASDVLGPVAGNVESTFRLSHLAVPGSVAVRANGVVVAPDKVTVTNVDLDNDTVPDVTDVTIAPNAVDAESEISITYRYATPSGETETTEWGQEDLSGEFVPWVAHGADQSFTLSHTPLTGSAFEFVLRIQNGASLEQAAYSLSGNILTLHPGYAPLGVTLEARYTYAESVSVTPVIRVASVFAGRLYNDVKLSVEYETGDQRVLVITKPASKKANSAEPPLRYSSSRYPLFRDLVNAVNADPNNNVVRLSVEEVYLNDEVRKLDLVQDVALTGGDDELFLTKDELYQRLHEAYKLLENYTVDYIVPLGVFADDQLADPNKNFADQLATIVAKIAYYHYPTQGIIATSSPSDVTLQAIQQHVDKLLSYPNRHVLKDASGNELTDSEGRPFDVGYYINVVAGPDRNFVNSKLGAYSANSPAAYAAFLSTLPPASSPMNKSVKNDRGLRYTYSNTQRNALTQHRYVTYKIKGQGTGLVSTAIEDAPTASLPDSDYRREATFRQVKEAIRRYRQAAEPFLGEPPTLANQNALDTALSKVDDELVNVEGVLERVVHRLIISPLQRIMGEAELELEMVPAGELRTIRMRVRLQPV